jgi:translation initiation factor 2 alpha subunit (eIF-2alpha)
MSNTKPVLYIEEVLKNGRSDMRMFIHYDREDTYVVYLTRRDTKHSSMPDEKMSFLSREGLVNFLLYSICETSRVSLTMCLMNFSELIEHNFSSVYEFYKTNRKRSEMFGYDNFKYYNYDGLMELAMIIRDARV